MKSEYEIEDEERSRTFSKDSKRQKSKKEVALEDIAEGHKESLEVGRNNSSKYQDHTIGPDEESRKQSNVKPSTTKQSILTKLSSKKQSLANIPSFKIGSEKGYSKGGTSKPWFEEFVEEEEKGAGKGDEDGEGEEKQQLERLSSDDVNIDIEGELSQFYAWLEKEPYLPKNIDEEVIITFLWESINLEEAERKFQNYFYARQEMKSVFRDRHPCSPNNLFKYDAVCLVPLTSGSDKKWIIFATWLAHDNPEKFSIFHMMKLVFTELDILLQENQIRRKTISILIDMDGYTEEHTKKITRFAGKKLCRLFTDCFPATFNGFYIINAPPHVADYTELFGPFDFHIVEYLEDLPGFLPKKFLPADLAGEPDAPLRNTLFEPFFKRLRRCGNWLAYEEFLRSQELMLRMTTTREEFYLESEGADKKKNKGGAEAGKGGGDEREKGKKGKAEKKQKKKKK